MGPAGSGKTTLLNLLGGLDVPTSGSITVAGEEITRMSAGKLTAWRARHVGFIFQMYNLIPVLTAFQNVELPLLLTKLSKAERRQHVETALGLVAAWPTASTTSRGSSPAARSSGWPSPGPWSPTRPSCCATNPPATSTARAPKRSWTSSTASCNEHGKTVLMVIHDPRAAERAEACSTWTKGSLVEASGRRGMKYFRLFCANLLRKKVRTT